MSGLLQTKEALAELGDRLAGCPMVAQYGAEEPGALLLAFSDLEGSFRVFLDEQLPKLADPTVQGEQLEKRNAGSHRFSPTGRWFWGRATTKLSYDISPAHLRRYCNGVLVCAAVQ
jgi:hypothetical protein